MLNIGHYYIIEQMFNVDLYSLFVNTNTKEKGMFSMLINFCFFVLFSLRSKMFGGNANDKILSECQPSSYINGISCSNS